MKQQICRAKLDSLAKKLNIQTQEDWYFVSKNKTPYRNTETLFRALKTAFPEFIWDPQLHHTSARVASTHTKRVKKHRELFDGIAVKLNIHKQEDWYNFTLKQITKDNPISCIIVDYYKASLCTALQKVYPEYEWIRTQFKTAKSLALKQHSNRKRRQLLDQIAARFGVETQEEWYTLTGLEISKDIEGERLLKHYNNSLYNALQSLYPEYEWNPLQFKTVPHHLYQHPENQKKALDSIAAQLGITTAEDWYAVTLKDVLNTGDSVISNYYNNSLFVALKNIYPQFDWNPLLFSNAPHHYLHHLSPSVIRETLFTHRSSDSIPIPSSSRRMLLFSALKQEAFGGSHWNSSYGEELLEAMLLQNNVSVERGKMISGYSVDLYLPQFNVALEYQGGQHYFPIHTGSFLRQQERDVNKRQRLQQLGIKLMEVPFWWKQNFNSFLATLHKIT